MTSNESGDREITDVRSRVDARIAEADEARKIEVLRGQVEALQKLLAVPDREVVEVRSWGSSEPVLIVDPAVPVPRQPPSWDPLGVCPQLWDVLPDLGAATSDEGLGDDGGDRVVSRVRMLLGSSAHTALPLALVVLSAPLLALSFADAFPLLRLALSGLILLLLGILAFAVLTTPVRCRMCSRPLVPSERSLGICAHCKVGDHQLGYWARSKRPFCRTCVRRLDAHSRRAKRVQCRTCLREGLVIPTPANLANHGTVSDINRSKARQLDKTHPEGMVATLRANRPRTMLVCPACHNFLTAEGTTRLSCKPCRASGKVLPGFMLG